MRKLWLALSLLCLGFAPAWAQNFTMPPPAGVVVGGYEVVSSCGGQSLTAGKTAFGTMDTTGKFCDSGSGGGGGGAVFGPTAVGSANANPPVVVGGTATGAAGQNVQGLSVVAPSVAPVTATNTAAVVDLRPDSPGIIATGGSTTALSVPTNLNSQYPVNSATTVPTPLVAKGTGSTGAVTGTLTPASTATAYVCGFNVSYVGGVAQVGPLVLSGLLGGSFTYQIPLSTATGGQTFTQTFTPCIPASAGNTAIVMTTVADGTATAVDVNIWGYGL